MGEGATLQRAFALFQDGYLLEAEALARLLPPDANSLQLLGAIAYRQGRDPEARDYFRRAHSLAPGHQRITLLLGHAARRMGEWGEATEVYREAQARAPASAEAAFYLGVALGEAGFHAAAAEAFLCAVLLQDDSREAYAHLLTSLRAALPAGVEQDGVETVPLVTADARLVSFIICSVDRSRFARVCADIARVMAGMRWEIVDVHDASSLAEGYERGAAKAAGELLVFCHDDLEILDPCFGPRLAAHLARCDLVGVAGTRRLEGPAWSWSGPPHNQGWVAEPSREGEAIRLCVYGLGPALIDGMQALDGVLLAMHRSVLERVRFDAQRFRGFHFYDLDFSYRAHRTGLRVAVARDLLLLHASSGVADPNWASDAETFLETFPELPRGTRPEAGTYFGVDLDGRDEALRFCAALRALCRHAPRVLEAAGVPADHAAWIRGRALAATG
jgi:hypothetical protein